MGWEGSSRGRGAKVRLLLQAGRAGPAGLAGGEGFVTGTGMLYLPSPSAHDASLHPWQHLRFHRCQAAGPASPQLALR